MLTLFSMPRCVQCNAIKRWLDKRGLVEGEHYIVKDVSTDIAAHQQVVDMGYGAAPVVLLEDGAHWYGFDDGKLEAWHGSL